MSKTIVAAAGFLLALAGCQAAPPPVAQAPVVDPQALALAQKAVDTEEVQNVISRYSDYYFENDFDNVAKQFALDRADTTYGVPMVITGGDAIRAEFARRKAQYETGKDPIGQLHVHPNSTPIIEIAGDGQTAKGVFDSFGPDVQCTTDIGDWLYLRKAVDFIKEPDGWKIWHMQDYPVFSTPYNRSITQHALDLAKAKKAKFLMASTSECYGDPTVSPQPETYWGYVNSVGPRSVYDEAKRFSEAITMAYYRHHKVDTRIVRIFNTYGPRMRLNDGRALPNFLYQALVGDPIMVYGDGKQTRSFCYVSDLIEGIYRLLESEEHDPVNVGNPNEITILEFAERVRKLVGATTPIIFEPLPQDDPKQRCPDITKAKKLLHWEPKVQLADGLQITYEYFRKRVEVMERKS